MNQNKLIVEWIWIGKWQPYLFKKFALIPCSAFGDVKYGVYDKTNFKPMTITFPEWNFVSCFKKDKCVNVNNYNSNMSANPCLLN